MNALFIRILLSVSLFILGSCSENQLQGNAGNITKENDSDADRKEASQSANEPVMVGGSFLTCQVSEDERWQAHRENSEVLAIVACGLSDENNRPVSVSNTDLVEFNTFDQAGNVLAVELAEIVEEQGTQWILAMNSYASPWMILAKFAGGVVFEAEIDSANFDPPADLRFPDDLQPSDSLPAFSLGPELITNGSFNQPALINPQFNDNTRSWSHFAPAQVNGWDAQWNNDTCANNVRIEIQRRLQDGRQFADLAGSCEIGVTPPAGGSNLRIFQTIPTETGSVYQLSFSYLIQNLESAAFQVEGPQGVLFNLSELGNPVENVWQDHTLEFVAVGDVSLLSFLESGLDPLVGTLLDNVSVKEVRRRLID